MTYQIYTCFYPAYHLALLGEGEDWLAQYQDNVTEWKIRPLYWQSGLPVGQHYKVAMSAHRHKSVSILICPYMLPGHKTLNKQNKANRHLSTCRLLLAPF